MGTANNEFISELFLQEGKAVSDTPATSENKTDKGHSATKHKRKQTKHHNGTWLVVLIVLMLLGLLGYQFGWKNFQEFQARFTGLETAMQSARDDTTKQLKQFGENIDKVGERQSHLEDGLDTYLAQNSHLRKDWLLAEAEYLIKLASHRLLLEQDVKTAIIAMEGANARLAEVGDPSLLKVRKQISKDIQKLKSVPTIDIAGISLTLSSLVQTVEKLPLQVPDPDAIRQRIEERTPEKRQVENWKSFFVAIWNDLKNLVVIRKHGTPVQPMLTTDQQFFLMQNLQLRLEQARLALLQGETGVYQERLQEIEKWIPLYFDTKHELTHSTIDTIAKLRKQDITPELPELTKSYERLEQYLSAGSTYKARQPKKKTPAKAKEEVKKPKAESKDKQAEEPAKPKPPTGQPKKSEPGKPEGEASPQVSL